MSKPRSLTYSARGRTNTRTVAIKNITGETVPAYGLVAVPGGTAQPNASINKRWIEVDLPTGGTDVLMVNVNLSVADDGFSHAWPVVPGLPLWIAYDSSSGTPAAGEEWGPVEDGTKLSEDGKGFLIVDVDTTNGLALATFMSLSGIRFAKLNEDLAVGSITAPDTATAEFYTSSTDDPPELSASGTTFTVVNYSTDFEASTGDFIIVARVQGVWHILAADC